MSFPIEDPTLYRVVTCTIDGPGTLQERSERIKHLWEVNGWDYLQKESYANGLPRMFFRKPIAAPDTTPFVDPNTL